MHATLLTVLIIIAAILVLIGPRTDPRARQHRPAASRAGGHPMRTEPFPRLARNRWARRDLARTLMTDNDYAGHISPPARPGTDRQ